MERREFGQLQTGECDNCCAVQPRAGMPGGRTAIPRLSAFSIRRWKPGFVCKNLSIVYILANNLNTHWEEVFVVVVVLILVFFVGLFLQYSFVYSICLLAARLVVCLGNASLPLLQVESYSLLRTCERSLQS